MSFQIFYIKKITQKIQNIVKDQRTEYSFDFSVNKLVAILEKYAL